jgi:hypothetical protein
MARLWFDTDLRLLCAYDASNKITFNWPYSVFEEYNGSFVSPSMYHFIANYLDENMPKWALDDLEYGRYSLGTLEAQALDEYYDLPILERTRLHEQTTRNLNTELEAALAKERAFLRAREDYPWPVTSAINDDYNKWIEDGANNWGAKAIKIADELEEEACWESGAEEGSSQVGHDYYEPMDEI